MAYLFINKNAEVILNEYQGQKNVTDFAYRFLHNQCDIEDGVTLKEIFTILNRDLGLYDLVLGNWCREFVEQAFSETNPKRTDDFYLELYWRAECEDGILQGLEFPAFHGVGIENDTIVQYSLSFSQPSDLMNVPLKFNNILEINGTTCQLKFSLLQILQGIIWELSYHGSPSDKIKAKDEMYATLERIKNGQEKLVEFHLGEDLDGDED